MVLFEEAEQRWRMDEDRAEMESGAEWSRVEQRCKMKQSEAGMENG
jgi:hypothetical protein